MAAAAQEFATALTEEEVELVLEQRRHVAATKAPPKRPPPSPAPAPPMAAQGPAPAAALAREFVPPWAPAGTTSSARSSQAPETQAAAGAASSAPFPETAADPAMAAMLQTPPEFAALNIYEYLMVTSINGLLLVASSDCITARQRQELRDIVSILRGFNFS